MKLKDYLKKTLEISVKLDEIEGDLCSISGYQRTALSEDYGYLEWVCKGEPARGGPRKRPLALTQAPHF